jgi:hypothetical protein
MQVRARGVHQHPSRGTRGPRGEIPVLTLVATPVRAAFNMGIQMKQESNCHQAYLARKRESLACCVKAVACSAACSDATIASWLWALCAKWTLIQAR